MPGFSKAGQLSDNLSFCVPAYYASKTVTLGNQFNTSFGKSIKVMKQSLAVAIGNWTAPQQWFLMTFGKGICILGFSVFENPNY